MSRLPHTTGRDLPPLAYAHSADHDPALTSPEHFRSITAGGLIKPAGGGLWTAPVTSQHPDGTPSMSAWIEWCRGEDWGADHYTLLTEIHPARDAQVLRIDTLADLVAIVDAYPHPSPPPVRRWLADHYPDWAAIGADWDAVFLTEDGQRATRLPPYDQPNLYSWDVATVFWFRPAYTVGRTAQAEPLPAAEVAA